MAKLDDDIFALKGELYKLEQYLSHADKRTKTYKEALQRRKEINAQLHKLCRCDNCGKWCEGFCHYFNMPQPPHYSNYDICSNFRSKEKQDEIDTHTLTEFFNEWFE